jgi:hypothetical protein
MDSKEYSNGDKRLEQWKLEAGVMETRDWNIGV